MPSNPGKDVTTSNSGNTKKSPTKSVMKLFGMDSKIKHFLAVKQTFPECKFDFLL